MERGWSNNIPTIETSPIGEGEHIDMLRYTKSSIVFPKARCGRSRNAKFEALLLTSDTPRLRAG